MDSRRSNDEFVSKVRNRIRPQNKRQTTNGCYNSIAVGDFAENRTFELFKPIFKVLSAFFFNENHTFFNCKGAASRLHLYNCKNAAFVL